MSVRRFDLSAGGDRFAFKEETEPKIAFWLSKYPEGKQRSAVIPLLWLAQKDNAGWLSEPAMRAVADRVGMPYIRVYEVATFYTMFRLHPVGEHHIQLCGTTPCMLRGAEMLKKVCEAKIGKIGEVGAGGKLSWEEVECLGACVNAPVAQVNDYYYEDLTEETFTALLDDLVAGRPTTPGPQKVDRITSAPEGGLTSLTDESLYDGSKAAPLSVIPNAPPPAEPETAPAQPAAAAPTASAAAASAAAGAPAFGKTESFDKAALASAATKPEDAAPRAKPTLEDVSRPEALAAARDGGKDDLKEISGVGPKIEGVLNELGIFHFDQVASWTRENVEWVDGYLAFRGRIDREQWISQAKVLAAGGETEFSKRQKSGDAGEAE